MTPPLSRSTLLSACLASLLLLASASAAPMAGELETTDVNAQGQTRLQGQLAAILQPVAPDYGIPNAAALQLEANEVRVETDSGDALRAEGVLSQVAGPDTSVREHGYSLMQGTGIRPGHRLDIIPASPGHATVDLEAACSHVRADDGDSFMREPKVQQDADRQDWTIDSAGKTAWTSCSQTTTVATITGDFVFSAWEVDFDLTEGNETHAYWSGHGDSQYSPHAASDEFVKEDRELYVYVTNGTMHVPLDVDANYALFLDSEATVDVNGSLYFEAASGEIQVGQERVTFEDEAVALSGDLHLQGRQGSWLLGGDVHDARLDGQAMALTVPQPSQETSPWLWFLPVVGVAALVAYPAWHFGRLERRRPDDVYALPGDSWRQREASGLAAMARHALDYGHPWRGLILVRLALLFSRHRQIRIIQATAYHDQDRVRPALKVHEALDGQLRRSPRDRCRNAWHALRIATRNGCDEEAGAWMRRAKAYDLYHFLELSQAMPTNDAHATRRRARGGDVAYN